jgi:hypothetical protein
MMFSIFFGSALRLAVRSGGAGDYSSSSISATMPVTVRLGVDS